MGCYQYSVRKCQLAKEKTQCSAKIYAFKHKINIINASNLPQNSRIIQIIRSNSSGLTVVKEVPSEHELSPRKR